MKTKWIMLTGIVLLATTIAILLPRFIHKDLQLPKTLGSLSFRQEVRGDKARAIINNMHGKGVTPKDNLITTYESSDGSATIYLSVYDERGTAQKTYEQMITGIEKGSSPFSEMRRVNIHGQEMSFCMGFGQAHYFFFTNESVYWITADFAVAEEAASELMRALLGSGTPV